MSTPEDRTPPTETPSPEGAQSAADVAATQAALTELAHSLALLPQAPPDDSEGERPEGTVALPVIEHEGTRYIPVFTNEEAMVEAGGDPETAVALPIVQLAANWPDDDLWLTVNPSSDAGITLPPDLVRALPMLAQDNGEGDLQDGTGTEDGGSGQPPNV